VSGRAKVLVVAGPTGAGKTAAALTLAEAFDAIVVSADAMQVYRGFDVGTAKATRDERARVEHRCIDVVGPDEAFDAADFVRHVDEAVATGRRVMLVGGTSLYLRSAVRGLVDTPAVDPALRAQLEALPDPHRVLQGVDPALAARLHPNDRVRVVRGLEVFYAAGVRLSDLQGDHASVPDRLDARGVWLDHDDLRPRLWARLEQMVARGYVDEVRSLLAAGVSREARPMRSLGYRHLADHVLDGLPLEEAMRRTERDTWSFARKQRNWMRALGWRRVSGAEGAVAARALVERWW
jgi:tRNA dimethylallyltransferase